MCFFVVVPTPVVLSFQRHQKQVTREAEWRESTSTTTAACLRHVLRRNLFRNVSDRRAVALEVVAETGIQSQAL